MRRTKAFAADLAAELAGRVRGRVLGPAHADYAALSAPWNLAAASSPALVVEVLDAADVVATVRFAESAQVDVAVQATGHGAVRFTRPTILVATHHLDHIAVEASARTARVGAGVRWRDLIAVTSPLALTGLPGATSTVGVVGYLTGGGLSPLGRTFGYASDYVTGIEVVTADGEIRRATPTENPDLFWGLRGGKGALGIITELDLQLLPLAAIYGGSIIFDGDAAPSLLPAWHAWCQTLPDAATTSITLQRLPDAPNVPRPLAGRLTVAIRFAWVGDPDEGAAALDRISNVAPVVFGSIEQLPIADLDSIHAAPTEPMPVYEASAVLDQLSDDAVQSILAHTGPLGNCPLLLAEIRWLGGALSRPPKVPSAVCHRDGQALVYLIGLAVPELLEAGTTAANDLLTSLAPRTMGALPNFNTTADPTQASRSYDRTTLARLSALAATYDPHELLTAAHPLRAVDGAGPMTSGGNRS